MRAVQPQWHFKQLTLQAEGCAAVAGRKSVNNRQLIVTLGLLNSKEEKDSWRNCIRPHNSGWQMPPTIQYCYPILLSQSRPTQPNHQTNTHFKMADRSNVSSDLIWEIARELILHVSSHFQSSLTPICAGNQNAYLVKRISGGHAYYFSRDPLNLVNKHSRTHAGFVNEKAVGVNFGANGEGVSLTTKKTKKNGNRPASSMDSVSWGKGTPSRK